MEICGFEKFSIVDYDSKICCTVFTNGCNFRCPFCHNSALVVDSAKNQPIDNTEIFDYLKKRKGLVDAVCISGGEPTLQHDLVDFVKQVKELGFLVKLDTNGMRPDVLLSLLSQNLIDYVAMDIKNCEKKYAETCGVEKVDICKIKESVEILLSSKIDYEFRTTLIAEYHTENDMAEIATWLSGAKRYFLQHYSDNDGCIQHGFSEIPYEQAQKFQKLMSQKIEKVALRCYSKMAL